MADYKVYVKNKRYVIKQELTGREKVKETVDDLVKCLSDIQEVEGDIEVEFSDGAIGKAVWETKSKDRNYKGLLITAGYIPVAKLIEGSGLSDIEVWTNRKHTVVILNGSVFVRKNLK